MFLKVEEVAKKFSTRAGDVNVLSEIHLELDQGEIGVILGPSGSGKSTLMNIIGGIDRADHGTVLVDEQDLTLLSDEQLTEFRRQKIGFVFQYYHLIPNLTVGENIEVVANISNSPLSIQEVLTAVGMANKRDRFPSELSGGEQQRVSIARAVVKNPALLLCDEPTGALDFSTSREILKLLEKINTKFGTTILMITHNMAISKMANRVFRLRDGVITVSSINETPVGAEGMLW